MSILPFVYGEHSLGQTLCYALPSKMNNQCKWMTAIYGVGVCTRSLRDTQEVAINPAGERKIESKGCHEERHHSQEDKQGWGGQSRPRH